MTTLRLKIDPKRHKRENNNQPQDFKKNKNKIPFVKPMSQ